MSAIQSFCHRSLLFEAASIKASGSTEEVIARYLSESQINDTVTERQWNSISQSIGNEQIRLRRLAIQPISSESSGLITMKTPLRLEFEYWNLVPNTFLDVNFHLINENEIVAFASSTINEPDWHGRPFVEGPFLSTCEIPGDLLNAGRYRVRLHFFSRGSELIFRTDDALIFDVLQTPDQRYASHTRAAGVVRPLLNWSTRSLSSVNSSAANDYELEIRNHRT